MADDNYNLNPYYDDFDENKNFYQILFKPGYAVQARELTQIQSILQNQITKFGNHIFKNGSVVIPGNSFADLSVPYIKLSSSFYGNNININDFDGKTIIGANSGLKAVVTKVVAADDTDPVTFYINYSGGSESGEITFRNSEEIYLEENDTKRASLLSSSSNGVGSIAYVNAGVFYVRGTFVTNQAQSIVISKYSSTPNTRVVFQVTTEIINSNQDTSLLDPALGSYNYSAPGADRKKISLTLTTLGLNDAIGDDYIELMQYSNGVLTQQLNAPKYSELDKALAERTYDESGSYVSNGFKAIVRENLLNSTNGGVYPNGNKDKLTIEISPGKAYIQGFQVDKIASTFIDINKARTSEHIANTDIILRPTYGQYIVLSDVVGSFDLRDRGEITFYNSSNVVVASGSATIGTAKSIAIDYLTGDPADALYKLWITDLNMTGANTVETIGGVTFGNGGKAIVCTQFNTPVNSLGFTAGELISHPSGRKAIAKYWDSSSSTLYAYKNQASNSSPNIGDSITGNTSNTVSTVRSKTSVVTTGTSGLIFNLPFTPPKALRDESNLIDLSYTTQRELTIVTDSSGNGSVSVASGTINPIEIGTFLAFGPSGRVGNDKFSLNVPGTTLTLTGGPANSTVKAYVAISNVNISPKTKTSVNVSETFVSPGANTITLSKTDVYAITSITDSVGDITPNYLLFDGQTDYAYTRSFLKLRGGSPVPSGNVTVNYRHYEHSVSGDFFSIDSYSSIPDFLETGRTYTSIGTGIVYDLASCIDFRPSVGSNGSFTGTNSRRNDIILNDTTFSSALQYYLPRIDSLVLNSSGEFTVYSGVPADNPYPPDRMDINELELYYFYIPAYTVSSGEVLFKRKKIDAYRMSDIQKLDERITNLAQFVLISAEESELTAYQYVDPETGLDRFKTGLLVENFDAPLILANSVDEDYSATVLLDLLLPLHEQLNCPLQILDSSTGYVYRNGYLMLPYTEVVFASQLLSSRVTNLNPFLVFKWNGTLRVVPESDTWVEVVDRPDILESRTETVYRYISVPCRPVNPPSVVPPPTVSPCDSASSTSFGAGTHNFTVPRYGSYIEILAIGAGGGGGQVPGGVLTRGGAGGDTIVYGLTAAGGRGGSGATDPGPGNTPGGAASGGTVNASGNQGTTTSAGGPGVVGGAAGFTSQGEITVAADAGQGGTSGPTYKGASWVLATSGGGGGSAWKRFNRSTLPPGTVLNITVGAGGTSGSQAQRGRDGIVAIRWGGDCPVPPPVSPPGTPPSPVYLDPINIVTITGTSGKKVVRTETVVGGVDIDTNKVTDYRIETVVTEISPGVYQQINNIAVATAKAGRAQITQTESGFDVSSAARKGLDLVNVNIPAQPGTLTGTIRNKPKSATTVQNRLDGKLDTAYKP